MRLLRRHGRRGVDGLGIDEATHLNCIKMPDQLADGGPRRIELSERGRALDQSNLGPPNSRELKLCLRDSTGALELDWILGVAGDFADKGFQLFRIFCG